MRILFTLALAGLAASNLFAQSSSRRPASNGLPAGYWPEEQSRAILEKTGEVRLAPDTSHLTEGERRAVAKLIEVGKIFQTVYEEQRHGRAVESHAALAALDKRLGSSPSTRNLLTLYRLFQGPIATTLENKREPLVPVELTAPGAAMYGGATKEEVEAFLAAHPDKRDSILDSRTAVRRANAANLRRDLGKLRQYPVLDTLHPGLRRELESALARPDAGGFYAVPYSVAWADEMVRSHGLLNEAADGGREGRLGVRALPAQPRARPSVGRLRVGRRGVGHGPLQEPQRADRVLRDLRRLALRREDLLLF